MRHRKAGIKLNRTTSHRQAMFRNMVTSLFKHDRIRTTDAKAKELRRWADHIITLAKRGDLNARRQALAIVREKEVVHKLFEEAQKRFGKINGGYTRIVKIGYRPGDAAAVSLIELVKVADKPKKKKSKTKAKKQSPAPTATKKAADKPDEDAAAEIKAKSDAMEDTPAGDAKATQADDEKKEAKPKAKKTTAPPAKKTKAPAKKRAAKKTPVKKADAEKAPAKEVEAKTESETTKSKPKAAKTKAPAKKASKDK